MEVRDKKINLRAYGLLPNTMNHCANTNAASHTDEAGRLPTLRSLKDMSSRLM